MLVPLLSPSGSWFAAKLYVSEAWLMPVTENVTLEVFLARSLLITVHCPLPSVVQLAVPVVPLLQDPIIVAFETCASAPGQQQLVGAGSDHVHSAPEVRKGRIRIVGCGLNTEGAES
jgi:hypothetical protein